MSHAPSDKARELPEREQIRVIWRPLYELGVKGQEQIDAEYMAHIVPVAVNETQKLIATKQAEARKQVLDAMEGPYRDDMVGEPIYYLTEEEYTKLKQELES